MSVDHLDPIASTNTNSIIDTHPYTGIFYYAIVADNVHYNSSLSNCIYIEYTFAHVREFVIPISIVTIAVVIVLTLRVKRRNNHT